MITAAIVAEFNPLHNGHKYLINEIKNKLHADNIVVIMSGDFVQRGQPAVISKQFRATMATGEGVDLVLLLPTVYSLAGADLFALSSVSILNRLGCIDYLCFASECADVDLLLKIDEELNNHDYEIDNKIKAMLNQGMTYAKARALLYPEYADVLEKSNNILALEYIRALKTLNSTMKPYTIKRQGCDYNDTSVSDFLTASAGGIRSLMLADDKKEFSSVIKNQLPSSVFEILNEQKNVSCPVDIDMFSRELFYAILSNQDSLPEYLDVSPSLSNKIRNNLVGFKNISTFIESIKSKELTYSRISRALMHIMLGIKKNSSYYREGLNRINHIRILSLSSSSKPLMQEIGRNSDLTLTASLPKVMDELNEFEKEIFSLDLMAFTLYDNTVSNIYGSTAIHEYSKRMN